MTTTQHLDTPTPVDEGRAAIYAAGITAFAGMSVLALAVLTQGDRLTRLQIGPWVAEFNPA